MITLLLFIRACNVCLLVQLAFQRSGETTEVCEKIFIQNVFSEDENYSWINAFYLVGGVMLN